MLRRKKTIIELPIEVISIKDEGYHLFVVVMVNEQPIRLLLDTGASRTVFDMEVIQQVCADIELEENEDKATGLGSSQVENFIVILDNLALG
ncbi:MAG: retropepsin-like aspartic protease, partial [Bacteroidia bacterium]